MMLTSYPFHSKAHAFPGIVSGSAQPWTIQKAIVGATSVYAAVGVVAQPAEWHDTRVLQPPASLVMSSARRSLAMTIFGTEFNLGLELRIVRRQDT
jgi:hypothetical protein